MTEIHPGHLSTQGKRKQAILNKERLVPKDSSKVLFSHCISRSPPILWPILVQSHSHPVTLLQCQGSPKPLLHQLLNSSGPEQLIICEWFKTFHANFQSQRYRPGSNAGAGLDHQSSHSLGRKAAETSPWGGHQQEVEVAGLSVFKYHCKTSLAQLMKMSQGDCGPMVMVITNANQSENAFSTYLLRLGLALESLRSLSSLRNSISGVYFLEQSDGLGQTKGIPAEGQVLFTVEKHQSCRFGNFITLFLLVSSMS